MSFPLTNKRFRLSDNTNEEFIDQEAIFRFYQSEGNLWAEYSGGNIKKGYLFGQYINNFQMSLLFNHVNSANIYFTGKCYFTLTNENGIIHIRSTWQFFKDICCRAEAELIEI